MRKYIFILLFWVISICGNGQNLVPNSSFEFFTSCPTSGGQLSNATPWVALPINNVEYFNACAPAYNYSVPHQSGLSFQNARTGDGIAGFWMLNGYGGNYREYLQVQLFDSLQNIKCYYISFYVNLQNTLGLAVNNFGVYLSTNSFMTTSGPAPYIPQLLGFNNNIVNDTLNWQNIQGIYIASGGEKYITLGNFYDDLNTDTLHTGNGTYPGAYYFIDDVSVIPIDSIIGGMQANAGNNTTIISGDSVFIGQEIANLNCNWYIGSTLIADSVSGLYVSPTVNTTYIVEQNLCGNITYDTVTVYVSGVGINENDFAKQITVYPNPTKDELFISVKDKDIRSVFVEITDITGKVVYSSEISIDEMVSKLNLNIDNGIYLVKITDKNTQKITTQKIVINK